MNESTQKHPYVRDRINEHMEERLADEMASSQESSDVEKLLRDIFLILRRHHEENEGYHKEENVSYILSAVVLFQ
jgi:hypothetical protein